MDAREAVFITCLSIPVYTPETQAALSCFWASVNTKTLKRRAILKLNMAVPITIYSADWCAFCHAAKAYFDKLGIQYVEKNVETDPANATEAVNKSGQTGIPVIDIDGTIVIGFDRPKIDAALAAHS